MNREQLEDLLDRFGPHERDWPEDVRGQMLAFIAQDQAARDLLREASEVSNLLNTPPPPMPTDLAARILGALTEYKQPEYKQPGDMQAGSTGSTLPWVERFIDWLGDQLWRPVGLAFVPLLLGFAIGLQFHEQTDDIEDAMTMLTFSEPAFFRMEDLDDAQ